MTVMAIRQTLLALVNQRRKVYRMRKYVASTSMANQSSLLKLANNVGYLSNCQRLDSWAWLVVRHKDDIMNLLPGKKFKKQRERITLLIQECEDLTKRP